MLDQHLWTTLHVTRAVVPGMVERGWGRILAVTSFTTATTPARAGIYATTKAAQETMLKVLAKECAGTGVTVNLVAVRAIDAEHARDAEPRPEDRGLDDAGGDRGDVPVPGLGRRRQDQRGADPARRAGLRNAPPVTARS